MGSKGSNSVSSSGSQTYTPNSLIYNSGSQALQQAMQAAGGQYTLGPQPVAGFNPFQNLAFAETLGTQGMAQPYFGIGENYLAQSAAPVTGQDVSNYYNPMANNVTAQLQNIFGQQNVQNTGSLTQQAGGVGADRIAVGQANLANQQGLAAGQTYAGLYQQALQAAEQQKQMAAGAGYGISQMGPAAQSAQLQAIGALGGAGSQQQQLSQAQLNALYGQQVAQFAFPFQTAQYLAGITGGLAPAMGGTTTGTQTTNYPSPSPLAQMLGIGTAGLGAIGGMKGSGGTGKGSGLLPWSSSPSYGGGNMWTGDAYGGSANNPLPGLGPGDYGARGGRVRYADGGSTYGKLEDLASRNDVAQLMPGATAENPYDTEALQDIGGSLPHFDDGGAAFPALPSLTESTPSDAGVIPTGNIGGGNDQHPLINFGGGPGGGQSGGQSGGVGGMVNAGMSLAKGLGNMGSGLGGLFGGGAGAVGDTVGGSMAGAAGKGSLADLLPMVALAKRGGPVGYDDGGGVDVNTQLPPFPGISIPRSGRGAPIPYTSLPSGSGQIHNNLQLHHLYPYMPGMQQQNSQTQQAVQAMQALGQDYSPSSTGGAVSPYNIGEHFDDGGTADDIPILPDAPSRDTTLMDPEPEAPPAWQRGSEAQNGPYDVPLGTTSGAGSWIRPGSPLDAVRNWLTTPKADAAPADNAPPPWQRNPEVFGPGPYAAASSSPIPDVPLPRPRPDATLPPTSSPAALRVGSGPTVGSGPSLGSGIGPYQMPQSQLPYPDATDRDWGQNLTRSPWMALVKAGAAMAQTRGPIGSAIGAGISAGAGELEAQRKALQTEEGYNQKAQTLYQQAKQHLDQYNKMTPYQRAEIGLRERTLNENMKSEESVRKAAADIMRTHPEIPQDQAWDIARTQVSRGATALTSVAGSGPHNALPDPGEGNRTKGIWYIGPSGQPQQWQG